MYQELCAYTLTHTDPGFLHQHVIDAYAVQHADVDTTPLQLTFALAGLYLHVERQFTGRQVQRVHALLASRQPRPAWPALALPASRGALTVADTLAAPAGRARDAAIHAWCASVWSACASCRGALVELLERAHVI